MAHTGAEIDFFYQDGQLIEVIHHNEMKEDNSTDSSNYYTTQYIHPSEIKKDLSENHYSETREETDINSIKMYNSQTSSSSGTHYVTLDDRFTLQQSGNSASYTILTPQQSTSSYKTEGKTPKYVIQQSNQSQTVSSTSSKSKPHASTHHTVQNSSISRRRKTDKVGKGLRHFSMKVCEKVKEKGCTTYNEVADELVAEEVLNQGLDSPNCDQKNIRRRVYDALNVLMAMNIISKDKKEIRWIGLPTNSLQECTQLEKEIKKRKESIDNKLQELKELIMNQIAVKVLVERNREAEKQGVIPTPNSSIQLPFIIVNTHKTTKINCSVSTDKSEYYFKFNDKFEIHDDIEVLKKMGLLHGLDKGECSYEDIEKLKRMVPKNFEKYIDLYANGQDDSDAIGDWEMSQMSSTSGHASGSTRGVHRKKFNQSSSIQEDEDLPSDSSDVD